MTSKTIFAASRLAVALAVAASGVTLLGACCAT
jgi:hypothetical protein